MGWRSSPSCAEMGPSSPSRPTSIYLVITTRSNSWRTRTSSAQIESNCYRCRSTPYDGHTTLGTSSRPSLSSAPAIAMPSPDALSGDQSPQTEIYAKTSPEGDVATISSVTLDEAAILASVKDVKAGGLCCFVGTTRDTFKGQSLSLTARPSNTR